VHADEKLTAFMELEAAVRKVQVQPKSRNTMAAMGDPLASIRLPSPTKAAFLEFESAIRAGDELA